MVQVTDNYMTPEQFVYWLQGFKEISGETPTTEQWQIIKDHLAAVFKKETPDYTVTTSSLYPHSVTTTVPFPQYQDTKTGSQQPIEHLSNFIC